MAARAANRSRACCCEAARRWRLDLGRSFLVGDRWSDVAAGQAVGCTSLLIVTPHSGHERCTPDGCVRDLTEAAEIIVSRGRESAAEPCRGVA